MDSGFRYGMVIENRAIRHFRVMVVNELSAWQYRPGYMPVPQTRAVVLTDRATSPMPVGKMVDITGRLADDWVVAE